MNVRITRIAFVCHHVTDIVRARDFYERVLGMKVALEYEGAPGKWWIEYDVDGVAFAITNVGVPNGNGGAVPAFEVPDVEAAAKALQAAGAMFVEPLTEYPRCRPRVKFSGKCWEPESLAGAFVSELFQRFSVAFL